MAAQSSKRKFIENAAVLGVCVGAIMISVGAVRSGGAAKPEVEPTWTTGLGQGMAAARSEHKLVLLSFVGSDWCPNCQELERKVFDTHAFVDYAAGHLVLVCVDQPNNKPQPDELKAANQKLLDKFDVDPLPTIILLDANTNTVLRVEGYDGKSPKEFIAALDQAAATVKR